MIEEITIGFSEYHDQRRAKAYAHPSSDIHTFSNKYLMAKTVEVLADAHFGVEEAPDLEVLKAVLDEVRASIKKLASNHEEHDYQRAITLGLHFEADALAWFRQTRELPETQQTELTN